MPRPAPLTVDALRRNVTPRDVFELVAEGGVALAWLGPDGDIQETNPGFQKMLKRSAADLVHQPLARFLAPEEHDSFTRPFRRLRWGGPRFTLDGHFVRSDELRVLAHLTFVPLEGEFGAVSGALVIAQDGSELQKIKDDLRRLDDKLEERMRDRAQELEAVVQELEAFNYSISHDLRTPLRSIRGFTDLLFKEGKNLKPTFRTHLAAIQQSVSRMEDIIGGLHRLSQMSRVDLQRQELDLSALAQTTLQLHRKQSQKAADIKVQSGLHVRADRQLVEILLDNLASNAFKFTRPKVKPAIEFGAEEREGRTYFFLRDNGVGFDPDQVSELFQPFRRLNADKEFEGTGIGLAIARKVVRRHGGRIFAEGKPGKGATFYFSLSRWSAWT